MTNNGVEGRIHEFIQTNLVFGDKRTFSDEDSLIRNGIVDSTGILELISFLEESFDVQFDDSELIAENFDSVIRIAAFLSKKSPIIRH